MGVSLVGPDGRFLHVNHKLCDILGYTPEELANMTFNDVTYPEDQDNGSLFGNPDVTGEKDGLRAEKRCVHKDGHMLWVIISFAAVRNPAGELQYFVTHTQDITDHKQLEDKLRQQSRAVESSPASIVITNINGNIEYVNPKFTQITGYTLEEAIGNNPRILKSGETPQDGYKKMWETIMAGEEWRGEFHNKKKNGELYYEWASISPIMDENGKISHFIAVKEDITERKRDQERILEALAFNQTILDSSPIGITIYNAAGDCIAANRAAGLITGTDPLSLLKQNFHTLESWKKNELYPAAMQALRIDQPVSILVHTHSSFKRELWLNATFVAFKSAGETHLLFMFENDSERQKAEKDLKNSNQKLAGLVKDLERRQKDSDLLRQMSDLLQVCTGVQEAYDIIGQFAPQIFLETSGAVFAAAQSPRSMEVASPWGDKLSSDLAFTSENCWSLRRGQVYLAKSSLPGLKCQHMDKAFVGSYLDIPLVASGEILGLLHIEWPQMEEPDRSMQDMAQIFADNISLSLSNIKLRETLHNQSVRDPLTHAFNRRYMEETLTRELPRAKRKNSHVGLIMLDIDYFKKFNDTYGHATGDLILTRLSSLLQSLVRGEDIVCRMGGEEFLMIMPDTDRETAFQRAEMIREAVQALRIEYNNQSLSGLTVSAGVAVYPENGRTSEQILEKVDAALYLAKGNGRNRVEQADGT